MVRSSPGEAAAKVGGLHANNSFPVEFLVHNLQIETNVIASAHAAIGCGWGGLTDKAGFQADPLMLSMGMGDQRSTVQ